MSEMSAETCAEISGDVREIWRKFADGYEVSNLGRVRSSCRGPTKMLKLSEARRSSNYPGKSKKGYLRVKTKHGSLSISRLVAKMFVPNPRPDIFLEVDHIDENIHNNCWLNLRWLSKGLNMLRSNMNGKFATFDKRRGNYRSCVKILKKKVTTGPYATEAEASEVGRRMKREAFERIYKELTEPRVLR